MAPNPQGVFRGRAKHNRTGLMVSIMRRHDMMESQTIGYQPMMACHRGETETPIPI